MAKGGNPEILLEAFVRTTIEYHGRIEILKTYWDAVIGMQYFPPAEMDKSMQAMQMQKYHALHHSSDCESLYRTASRVVWRILLS